MSDIQDYWQTHRADYPDKYRDYKYRDYKYGDMNAAFMSRCCAEKAGRMGVRLLEGMEVS